MNSKREYAQEYPLVFVRHSNFPRMGCTSSFCLKLIISIFNIILLLLSIGILIVGIWVRFSGKFDGIVFGLNFSTALIILGTIPASVAIVGILAMILSSRCFVYLYGLLMLLVVTVGETVLGIFAFIERGKMRDQLLDFVKSVQDNKEVMSQIRVYYNCKDVQTCVDAMTPKFEYYCLIAGIAAFCLAGISLFVSILTFIVARGSSRPPKPEAPSRAKPLYE